MCTEICRKERINILLGRVRELDWNEMYIICKDLTGLREALLRQRVKKFRECDFFVIEKGLTAGD